MGLNAALPPGACIGILGSGQLGRMLCHAARELGYRTAVFSEEAGSPAGQIADREYVGRFESSEDMGDFADSVQVVTYEFENIPVAALQVCLDHGVPVRPGPDALHTIQSRIREKTHLQRHGVPVSPFVALHADEPPSAAPNLSFPCLLKTARFGYDGKGQVHVASPDELPRAWQELGGQDAVLESVVDFAHELSVVMARSSSGDEAIYPVVLNHHRNLILDISVAPAPIPAATARRAQDLTREIAGSLDLVGLFCVEYFLLATGELMVNEIAPRTHNSGHWTIEGCETSQFAQQVRAVCGLPLGSVAMRGGSAMANLLGELWPKHGDLPTGHAEWGLDAFLHLYGKGDAKPGRKMGHVTATAMSARAAAQRVDGIRQALGGWPAAPEFQAVVSGPHPNSAESAEEMQR